MRDDVPPPLPAAMPAPGDASDSALAMRLASGERPALGLIYQRHKGLVYRFALLWTGSAPAAADVTQDVFVHLLTHANDFDATRGALPAWLLGIAHNFARRRTPCVEEASALDDVADDVPALDVQLHDRRSVDALRRAIALLPPHYRDVLVLVELSERSYAETAVICGCPLNTIRSRLARARALLARELGIGDDKPALPAASWTPREAGRAPIGPIGSHDEH